MSPVQRFFGFESTGTYIERNSISSFEPRSIGATEVEVCGAAGTIDGRELVKHEYLKSGNVISIDTNDRKKCHFKLLAVHGKAYNSGV
ncbi:hypothetical protein Bhyg_05242 [Pseudolycoriella hygida]|uniref:Uncharacterized protein n=1 Tax=Pseudolycoriella hygida TaxID=35572 RepID=A0A9Q0NHS9_9DIPT|nr:hypothetical protein Bhyg_05242 [Pseudolycoriella hygida]